jgi:ketosteroid isomerase-like protein
MSRENLEIVRRFFEGALDDRDRDSPAYLAEDLEFIPFTRLAGPASQGPRGFVQQVAEVADQFAEYQVRPQRLEQVGDLVVADLRREARSERSPAIISDRFAQVFTVRDGRITRIESYPSFAEALEAARLPD